ncbi:hypothetical protein HHI36_013595, partial [Cryptolaemus montrouzieri]
PYYVLQQMRLLMKEYSAILDDPVMASQHLPGYLNLALFIRCPVRNSKFDSFVKEVTLLEGNPEYAHIKHPDGRESTVSTRHLARMRKHKEETLPDSTMTDAELSGPQDKITSQENDGSILDGTISESVEGNRTNLINQTTDPRNSPFIRRSSRPRRTPAYLEDYEHHYFKDGGECGQLDIVS